jgi:hypothetical protein
MTVFLALPFQREQRERGPFHGQHDDQQRAGDERDLFARGPRYPLHRVGLQQGCGQNDQARADHEHRVGEVFGLVLKFLIRWRHGGSVVMEEGLQTDPEVYRRPACSGVAVPPAPTFRTGAYSSNRLRSIHAVL